MPAARGRLPLLVGSRARASAGMPASIAQARSRQPHLVHGLDEQFEFFDAEKRRAAFRRATETSVSSHHAPPSSVPPSFTVQHPDDRHEFHPESTGARPVPGRKVSSSVFERFSNTRNASSRFRSDARRRPASSAPSSAADISEELLPLGRRSASRLADGAARAIRGDLLGENGPRHVRGARRSPEVMVRAAPSTSERLMEPSSTCLGHFHGEVAFHPRTTDRASSGRH